MNHRTRAQASFPALATLAGLLAAQGCAARKAAASSLQEELGYPKSSILAIVHVDDLGMHPDESSGGLETIAYGLAKSGSAIVPAPDFERLAASLGASAAPPGIDIGVHVAFTSEWAGYRWGPLLPRDEAGSLRDGEGFFPRTLEAFMAQARVEEAAREMEAQVDRAFAAGLRPTHLDAHMGSFCVPSLFPAAMEIARRRNLVIPCVFPGSKPMLESMGLVSMDSMDCIYAIEGEEAAPSLRPEAYKAWLRGLGPGLHYLAIHAATVSPELASIVEMPYIRSGDKSFWTSPETKAFAEGLGIRFIGMRELQSLQARKRGSEVAAP